MGSAFRSGPLWNLFHYPISYFVFRILLFYTKLFISLRYVKYTFRSHEMAFCFFVFYWTYELIVFLCLLKIKQNRKQWVHNLKKYQKLLRCRCFSGIFHELLRFRMFSKNEKRSFIRSLLQMFTIKKKFRGSETKKFVQFEAACFLP